MIAAAALSCLYLAGALEPLERTLLDLRFSLYGRQASGDLVVVQIGPRSIRELGAWPWPRSYHAEVIDRLFAAGVSEIAIDIDLSSRSTQAADEALAAALQRHAGRVILPAFAQPETDADGEQRLVYAFPAAPFRPHVRVGAVNVFPDADGRVRQFSTVELLEQGEVPTMPAAMVGRSLHLGEFYIDFGIRSQSVPLIPYVDVLRGDVAGSALAGKKVIIGATAIELGDRFAVPVEGVLPGPVVQALAYETLVQGRALHRTTETATLAFALVLGLLLAPAFAALAWHLGLGAAAALSFAFVALAAAVQARAPVILDVAPALAAVLLAYATDLVRKVEHHARQAMAHRVVSMQRAAMMNAVVDDSFDGIIITEPDGKIIQANPSSLRLLGWEAGDITAERIDCFLPNLGRDGIEGAVKQEGELVVATCHTVETEVPRKDGNAFAAEVVMSRSSLRLNAGRYKNPVSREVVVYTFRDITQRRAMEAAQRAALQEAQVASRAKTELLTNMSHELRTPLNAIIGFAEIIKGELLGPLGTRDYLEYAEDIHHSGSHLLDVINDILDVSRIETGAVKLRESNVCLAGVLTACANMVKGRLNAVPLTISLPEALPKLRGDERLLKQIVVNLLSNAAKFTLAGSITVAAMVEGEGEIVIAVTDTGVGIPEGEIGNLAKPFYQVDSSLSRKFEGTGLGLSLVAGFAALHGGTVEIQSRVGEGTTVRVRFPAERTLWPGSHRGVLQEALVA